MHLRKRIRYVFLKTEYAYDLIELKVYTHRR